MENGEVVEEVSTPSIEEQMLDALSENEESQSSAADSDIIEEDGSDAEEVEAQDEQENEEEVEEEKDELIPKSSFMKRINSLQASRRKAETRASDLESKMAQYDVLLTEMKERLDSAESKLSDYDEHDPRDAQIRALKLKSKLEEMRRSQMYEQQQRQMEQQQQEIIDSRADEIIDTAKRLSDKYNTFSPEELVITFSKTDDVEMEELAQKLHKVRLDHYKKHLSKSRGMPKAPAPMKTQGARSLTQGHSAEDMVAFLESISGDS